MMKISSSELKTIMKDYEYDDDIMNEEDDRVHAIKWALQQLPEPDRIIFLLQCDIQSQRKTGEILGVSHSTVGKEINRIKERIIEILDDYNNTFNRGLDGIHN